jgi:uncharacterized protein YhdP
LVQLREKEATVLNQFHPLELLHKNLLDYLPLALPGA